MTIFTDETIFKDHTIEPFFHQDIETLYMKELAADLEKLNAELESQDKNLFIPKIISTLTGSRLKVEAEPISLNFEPEFIDFDKLCEEFDQLYVNSFSEPQPKPQPESITTALHHFAHVNKKGLDAAKAIEAKALCNIDSYPTSPIALPLSVTDAGYTLTPYTPPRIKAVVDWLQLSFEVDESNCKFTVMKDAHSRIKEFLTKKTGTAYYIEKESWKTFTIKIHDVNNLKQLLPIISILEDHYGAQRDKMKVKAIELSHDFYNVKKKEFLIALYKSIQLPATADNMRIYKDSKGMLSAVPASLDSFVSAINKGYTVGINDSRTAPHYYRIYHKVTDKGAALAADKHRMRIEVCLTEQALIHNKIDCSLNNLHEIIKSGFKLLRYTHPNDKASTIKVGRKSALTYYTEKPKPFGLEQFTISSSRHKREFLEFISKYRELNDLAKFAERNLLRGFLSCAKM